MTKRLRRISAIRLATSSSRPTSEETGVGRCAVAGSACRDRPRARAAAASSSARSASSSASALPSNATVALWGARRKPRSIVPTAATLIPARSANSSWENPARSRSSRSSPPNVSGAAGERVPIVRFPGSRHVEHTLASGPDDSVRGFEAPYRCAADLCGYLSGSLLSAMSPGGLPSMHAAREKHGTRRRNQPLFILRNGLAPRHRYAKAGATTVCKLDQSGAAKAAGCVLRPTTLFIFGNTKAGAELMDGCRWVLDYRSSCWCGRSCSGATVPTPRPRHRQALRHRRNGRGDRGCDGRAVAAPARRHDSRAWRLDRRNAEITPLRISPIFREIEVTQQMKHRPNQFSAPPQRRSSPHSWPARSSPHPRSRGQTTRKRGRPTCAVQVRPTRRPTPK